MPVYNCGAYLREAIESVLAQTYTDWELLIVNDSSTDDGPEIAASWAVQDARIRVLQNIHLKGLAGALNTGLAVARGFYIARADADDINVPERLQVQYNYLQMHHSIDIVGSWYETFGQGQKTIIRRHPTRPVVIAWKFLTNTYFCHPTTLFRRSILTTVPQYPYTGSEDFGFFSQVVHTHQGANIRRSLLKYRQHGANYSHTEKPAIALSIKETYTKNFAWYTGSTSHADLFFRFHAQYDLSVSTIATIIDLSSAITRKITTQYNSSFFDKLYLSLVVARHIALAVAAHYARALK